MAGTQYPADKLPNGADMTDVVAFFDAIAKRARGSLTFIEHGDEKMVHRLVLRAGGVVWTTRRFVVSEFEELVTRARTTGSRAAREAALAIADEAIEACLEAEDRWRAWANRQTKMELLVRLDRAGGGRQSRRRVLEPAETEQLGCSVMSLRTRLTRCASQYYAGQSRRHPGVLHRTRQARARFAWS